jgi:uncharacterized membrane protein
MSIGPVEYLIVGFPGNRFNGEMVPALAELVESGTIRIIDLLFITKDADGNVEAFEIEDHEDLAPYGALNEELDGLLNDEDIEMAAEVLEPNSSAAFLVWEDCWARKFAEAARESGGVILAGERIPHQIIEEALAAVGRGVD